MLFDRVEVVFLCRGLGNNEALSSHDGGGAEEQFFQGGVLIVAESSQRVGNVIRSEIVAFVGERREFVEYSLRLLHGFGRTLYRDFFAPCGTPDPELFLNQFEVTIMVPKEDRSVRAFT
jgi:hypothetical protein